MLNIGIRRVFMKKIFCILALIIFGFSNVYGIEEGTKKAEENPLKKEYSRVTKEQNIMEALEMLKGTPGNFSREAILGNNLSGKPVKIEYKNLYEINEIYTNFDALGWKKGNKLYIYINPKHQDAPKEALAALLAHEALHQDELNSINEETYAWTLEAAVWTYLTEDNPAIENISHPLIQRENLLKQLFVRGDYTDTYIRKSILTNPGYQNLPSRSPGFEDIENL